MANEKRLYKGNVVYSVKGIANISGVKESAILCRAETLMLKYPKNVYRISNEGQAYFFDEVFISALADSMYDKYVRKSSIVSHKKYRAFIDKYCTFEKAVIVETKKEKPEPKPEGYMTMLEYMHSRGICSSFASGKFYQEREVINSHRKMVAVNNKRGRHEAYAYDKFAIAHMDDVIKKMTVRSKSIFDLDSFKKYFQNSLKSAKAAKVQDDISMANDIALEETEKKKTELKPERYMTLLEYVYSRGICSNFVRGKFYQERETINSHRKMVAVNNKRGRQSAYGYDEFAIAHMDEVIRKIPVRSKAIFNWENFRKHFPVPVESPVSSDTVKVPASVTPLTDVELVAELRADMQQLMSKYDALLEMLSGRNTEEASNLQSAAEALIQDIDVF